MAKGMGFAAAAAAAAKSSGESLANGAAMVAAGARKASPAAVKANPSLTKVSGVKAPFATHGAMLPGTSSPKHHRSGR